MVNTQAGDALVTNNDSDNGTNALEAIVEEMGTVSTTDLKAAPSHAPLRAIITGAPASGKGTQCERIVGAYGMVHLSTGDMLRAAVKAGTALGAQADGWMKSGRLVPDELIISIITERLGERDCVEKGWLLDGFPRTAVQAEALAAAGLVPDCVLELDVPEESLIDRVVSRRLDPVSGAIYNVRSKMPTDPEVLARLVQRADDTEETARKRLAAYRANLEALRAAYPGMVRRDAREKPGRVRVVLGLLCDGERRIALPDRERHAGSHHAPGTLLPALECSSDGLCGAPPRVGSSHLHHRRSSTACRIRSRAAAPVVVRGPPWSSHSI